MASESIPSSKELQYAQLREKLIRASLVRMVSLLPLQASEEDREAVTMALAAKGFSRADVDAEIERTRQVMDGGLVPTPDNSQSQNALFGKQPSEAKLLKQAKRLEKKNRILVVHEQQPVAAAASDDSASSNVEPQLQQPQQQGPKVPCGTSDTLPEQMVVRNKAIDIIRNVFESYGAVSIDTPVFELKQTLTGRYGEDSKLIFDLADQGGELCALRYDLTVPFARYLATHGLERMKRYQIARVYRRDQPAPGRGRFREFYQVDLDIAGAYPPMTADAEALEALQAVLDRLPGIAGTYVIKLNHRRLLDGVMQVCGVPDSHLRTICSSIDKLDKHTWDEVKHEMVMVKGLDAEVADRLGSYVCQHGEPTEMLLRLRTGDATFVSHPLVRQALDELELLVSYLVAAAGSTGLVGKIEVDLSLARGLDYYGVIFEAVLIGNKESSIVASASAASAASAASLSSSPSQASPPSPLGSIAAGGRYDDLVGMFANKSIPSVGISIGLERILGLVEAAMRTSHASGAIRATTTQVFVISMDVVDGLFAERRRLVANLRAKGIPTETSYELRPSYKHQIGYAIKGEIPLVVLLEAGGKGGEAEGSVVLRNRVRGNTQESVPLVTLAEHIRAAIASIMSS